MAKIKLEHMNLIPTRGIVVFPGVPMHFDIGRTKSVAALEDAVSHDLPLAIVCQKDADTDEPKPDDLYGM
ncbi:MAG: LON peptidase substrate-binding domain-containing protein, partial [Clostridia bacterium]|nr:LON peptidase substrate-binding domain-containing protein [Clostridia bacterium]